jgi:hypothetical protein
MAGNDSAGWIARALQLGNSASVCRVSIHIDHPRPDAGSG